MNEWSFGASATDANLIRLLEPSTDRDEFQGSQTYFTSLHKGAEAQVGRRSQGLRVFNIFGAPFLCLYLMGSEGPAVTTVHVTGFKKFHGVAENPTETIIANLKEFMHRKGLPKGLVLGNCTVLETAGQGALGPLYQIFDSALSCKSPNSDRTILIHLGVNSGATKFAIEHQAVNEATFRCPDELGWKPQKVPITPTDGDISKKRVTTLPVNEITDALAKKGYDVISSDDAGRFVCNYVYYHSLRFAEKCGIKSLFVHVPLFLTIEEETQMQFIASLLEVLASVM